MRDHNRLAREWLLNQLRYGRDRVMEPFHCPLRQQLHARVRRSVLYQFEIGHQFLGEPHRVARCAVQIEIRPQRGTYKPHVADSDCLILQEEYIGAGGSRAHFRYQVIPMLAVKFMIARNIHHRDIRKGLERPGDAIGSLRYVAD